MATTTNYAWETPDDTDLVKDGAAAIRTLGSSIDTTTKALNPSTTLGDIEYRSSTANTNTRLGIGSSGQVLTVSGGGVPSWAAPTSGLTLINRSTFTNVASHTIDSVFTSTYTSYLVAIEFIYAATAADDLLLRFRYGSSTETGVSYYGNAINAVYSSASVANYPTNGLTSFALTSSSGAATNPCAGLLEINRVGSASEPPVLTGNILEGNDVKIFNVGGGTITARTYTGVQFFSTSSNITGAISVYGLATS